MAETINHIAKGTDATLILYGDVADGSSLLFYTQRQALLVNGRVRPCCGVQIIPMLPGCHRDQDLLALWGAGPRRFLFVPGDVRAHVDVCWENALISCRSFRTKLFSTDRPL